MNIPRPWFIPICSTSFCFNALYQLEPFPNLNTVIFSLTPSDWLISIYLSLFYGNMLFYSCQLYQELGHKTRTMYMLFQKMHFANWQSVTLELTKQKLSGHISITFAMEMQAQLSETLAQNQYIIQQMHSVIQYIYFLQLQGAILRESL